MSDSESSEHSSRFFRQTAAQGNHNHLNGLRVMLSRIRLIINIYNQTFEPCFPLLHHSPQTKLINSTSDTHQYQRCYSVFDSQNEIQWCSMQRGLAFILLPGWEVCICICVVSKIKVYLICTETLIALEHQWGHQQWLVLINWPFTVGPPCSSLPLNQVN